jgi:hypothetical protein
MKLPNCAVLEGENVVVLILLGLPLRPLVRCLEDGGRVGWDVYGARACEMKNTSKEYPELGSLRLMEYYLKLGHL